MHIALTGSTGFLGSEFLRDLCLNPEVSKITAFIPDSVPRTALSKLDTIIQKWTLFGPRPNTSQLNKIVVHPLKLGFPYDPKSSPQNSLSKTASSKIEKSYNWDYFVHLAGLTDLNPELQIARRNNLFATQHALRWASESLQLKRYIHLSTAFVCGEKDQSIVEPNSTDRNSQLSSPMIYNNDYERTKLEAECCVQFYGIPFTIIRPSIIVGRSYDGYFPYTKVIYSLWKAWFRDIAPRIPVDHDSYVDIVPLDWVSKVIFELMVNPEAESEIFHACAAEDRQNNMNLIKLASIVFERGMPKTCPRKILDMLQLPSVYPFVPYDLKKLISEFSPLLIYMNSKKRIFSMKKTNKLLAKNQLILRPFSQWGPNIFEFCKRTSWGKISTSSC